MNRKRWAIVIVALGVFCCILAYLVNILLPSNDDTENQAKPTVEVIITELPTVDVVITESPTIEIVYGVINCPECEGIALILWKQIGNIGGGAGEVHHGDRCKVINSGSYEGIWKYKLNCAGKIGWLRGEGVLIEK